MPPHLKPGPECAPRLFGDRNHAFLPALSHHPHFLRAQFEISHVQGDKLTDSNSRTVKKLDQGAVPKLHPRMALRALSSFRSRLTNGAMIIRNQLLAIID